METIAIAGASGFVGSALRRVLADRFRFRALTRSPVVASSSPADWNTEWRQCDLFSLPQLRDALAGTRRAVYLVHSMLPSARLNQSRFEDLDLLLADNFARMAAANGLEEIVFLGGLIPEGSGLSPHLRSRLEVEAALGSTGVPVTRLRAGVIVGPGGSSLRILVNLIRRLPVMVLPRWVNARTRCIAIDDLVEAFRIVLGEPQWRGGCYDLAGPDALTYRRMIETGARAFGLRRLLVTVPIRSVRISKLWIQVFSGAPRSLVSPLVDSLRHDLDAAPNPLLDRIIPGAKTFEASLRDSCDADGHLLPNPRERTQAKDSRMLRDERRVRSVQRVLLPDGVRAEGVARIYFDWLGTIFRPLLSVRGGVGDRIAVHLYPLTAPLLVLERDRGSTSDLDPCVFFITGGLLANPAAEPPGRFEFREVGGRQFVITAIHAYRPRLQWHFYNVTQAQLHLFVMRAFGSHLRGETRRAAESANL
ncbi:MAG: NAD(P)H-binding protein [Opitutales bacterium]|nr:NAD(P)H-binding protein [Opitutales bacterium]